MTLHELKQYLSQASELKFILPNGQSIPAHFHITEAGVITKHFIDCGGTVRQENAVTFQLWTSVDTDHRLAPEKLLSIIKIAENRFPMMEEYEVEIEYQQDTIGKYGIAQSLNGLELTTKHTACLAEDQCGIPVVKTKVNLAELATEKTSCCTPGRGCC